ncbi:hypothetical protein P7C70_g5081, partial [Phenoliferia sp. Uapishka_3]
MSSPIQSAVPLSQGPIVRADVDDLVRLRESLVHVIEAWQDLSPERIVEAGRSFQQVADALAARSTTHCSASADNVVRQCRESFVKKWMYGTSRSTGRAATPTESSSSEESGTDGQPICRSPLLGSPQSSATDLSCTAADEDITLVPSACHGPDSKTQVPSDLDLTSQPAPASAPPSSTPEPDTESESSDSEIQCRATIAGYSAMPENFRLRADIIFAYQNIRTYLSSDQFEAAREAGETVRNITFCLAHRGEERWAEERETKRAEIQARRAEAMEILRVKAERKSRQ